MLALSFQETERGSTEIHVPYSAVFRKFHLKPARNRGSGSYQEEKKSIMSVPSSSLEPFEAVTEFSISGMNCEHCAKRVSNAIGAVAGVQEVNVSLPSNSASVRWSAAPNIEAVLEAVEKAGYKAQKK